LSIVRTSTETATYVVHRRQSSLLRNTGELRPRIIVPATTLTRRGVAGVPGAGQRCRQALLQNDGQRLDLAQGTPVHAYLPADALRVLAGARVPVAASAAVEAPLAN
jgi:hypothetical protein